MAFLRFNKSELVNLSYSLKREILCANQKGSYCNTSISTCNTRRYHGLLAVPVAKFNLERHILLSSLDESLIFQGKNFNLGIHCYGDIYEPRGHKYIVDFEADPAPKITYKVGQLIFSKTILMSPDTEQVMIKYELQEAPSNVTLSLKPFLAFRNIHDLTIENPAADCSFRKIKNGLSFNLYPSAGFPDLNLQFDSGKVEFNSLPHWYKNITYSDEMRRGFDCREDLFVPGCFEVELKKQGSLIFSASTEEILPSNLKKKFSATLSKGSQIGDYRDQLLTCAEVLKCDNGGKKKITAGFSWLSTGLLRETLLSLPGLTLYANGDKKEFEEILDNLLEDEKERLYHKTTQIEAPLYFALLLQQYIEFGADAKKVWKKYGKVLKNILSSYCDNQREEVSICPNGLLWAHKKDVALTWMNAYIDSKPVTERAGFQVETNAFWYNAICFALEMEQKYGEVAGEEKGRGSKKTKPKVKNAFIERWSGIADLIKSNYQTLFWNEEYGILADFVDGNGQNLEIRPNMLYAAYVYNSLIEDEKAQRVIQVVESELLTRRGIRTLSPRDIKYKAVYEGTQHDRDWAYHQGSAWPFLLGPYMDLCFRMRGKAFLKKAAWLIEGFYEDLNKHGVGAFSELYDGDPPHEPHGAISSALSVASLLRIEYLIDKYKENNL